MYLPLGITSKGKMIIIFGAILASIIGVYANTNFPLWQTATMLLLIIITMTFFMGEKFEGLIFDQEGNDLTAYKSDRPEGDIEEKDDLIHLIGNQKQAKGLANQELQQEQTKETKDEIDDGTVKEEEILTDSPETVSLESTQMIEIENEQPAEKDEPFAQEMISWDEEIELFQNESPLLSNDEAEVKNGAEAEHQSSNPDLIHLMEGEEDKQNKPLSLSNEGEPYGSLTNDEVAFLLNKDELISSEESSVHYMEDIEILLEDDDEDLMEAKELTAEEPPVDPIINVYAEGDLPLFINELEEENSVGENTAGDESDEYIQTDLENEDFINTEETKPEQVVEATEWTNSDQETVNHLSDLTEELQVSEPEDVISVEEEMDLSIESSQQEAQKPNQPTTEHSVLQTQLFDTFFNQIKLAKMTCSEDEYEKLINGYLKAELPDQTYYQFSTLLLDHLIEQKKWEELKQNLLELQTRFEQYPVLVEQLEYLYQTYCV